MVPTCKFRRIDVGLGRRTFEMYHFLYANDFLYVTLKPVQQATMVLVLTKINKLIIYHLFCVDLVDGINMMFFSLSFTECSQEQRTVVPDNPSTIKLSRSFQ